MSSKRSVISNGASEFGSMPSAISGRIGTSSANNNLLSSDRRPLNVLN